MKKVALILGLLMACTSLPSRAAPRTVAISQLLASANVSELLTQLKREHKKVRATLELRLKRHRQWKTAVQARDASAAMVESLKNSGASNIDNILAQALSLDEEVAKTRSSLLQIEARVAEQGVVLLRIYDAILEQKRLDAHSAKAASQKRKALESYRQLVIRRDKVRDSLRPISAAKAQSGEIDLGVTQNDDIESLLEKADLARDLEERYLKRASTIKSRILELQEQQSLAKDLAKLTRSDALFDESSSRLIASGERVALRERTNNITQGANDQEAAERGDVAAPAPAEAVTDDTDGDQFQNGGLEAEPNDPGAPQVVESQPTLYTSERVFLGADIDTQSALLSGSMAELEALQKASLQQAKDARKKAEGIRKEIRQRSSK